jgi:hypothetical protein
MGEKLMNILVIIAALAVIFFCAATQAGASIDNDLKDASIIIEDEVKIYILDGEVVWTFWKIDEWLEYIKRQLSDTINADEL